MRRDIIVWDAYRSFKSDEACRLCWLILELAVTMEECATLTGSSNFVKERESVRYVSAVSYSLPEI